MNSVTLIGRLTRDPEVRFTQGANSYAIANYSLAVDRPSVRQNSQQNNQQNEPAQTVDFIPCVCFGKTAEFAEKYLRQGMRVAVQGAINTGNYINKDGQKVNTWNIRVERHEFCDSKRSGSGSGSASAQPANGAASTYADPSGFAEGFMAIPDGIDDEALPFG